MIPLRLNFLSPEKRRHLQNMVKFQFLKAVLEVSLISLCIVGVAMIGGEWVLQDYFTDLSNQISLITSQNKKANQEITDINKILADTEKLQKNYTIWTEKIAEISNIIPVQVFLTNLTIDIQNQTINLSGHANNRADLLDLKEKLLSLSWVASIDIPSSLLTLKEDIAFNLTGKIK